MMKNDTVSHVHTRAYDIQEYDQIDGITIISKEIKQKNNTPTENKIRGRKQKKSNEIENIVTETKQRRERGRPKKQVTQEEKPKKQKSKKKLHLRQSQYQILKILLLQEALQEKQFQQENLVLMNKKI